MGLIRLAGDVIGAGFAGLNGALESGVWKEYFESGDMSNGILMKRAERIISGKGKNKRADENLITSGSGIDVQEGQCMILVENGKIVDFCTEAGRYTFDASTAPSLLSGENKGLKAIGKEILSQWSTGGQRFSTQRIYFINMCEMISNPIYWGSGDIMFQHIETDINDNPVWKIMVKFQGNGQATIGVSDPVKFFKNIGAQKVGADNDGLVKITDIQANIKSALTGKLRQAIGDLSKLKIGATEVASHEGDICNNLNELLDAEWTGTRGIDVRSFTINDLAPDEKAMNRITEYQETVGYAANPAMANVNVQRTMAEGIKAAGENGGSGAIMGLGMGIGAMGGTGLGQMQFQNQQPQQQTPVQSPDSWVCPVCGKQVTGKFCSECGAQKAVPWTCTCGTQNTGKFCSNCGNKKVEEWTCECGATNTGKFCSNCGAQSK